MVIKRAGTDNFRSSERQTEIKLGNLTAFVTLYLPAKAEISFREGDQKSP